jgi:hypothetical protein
MKFLLLTVTDRSTGKLFSTPIGQITGIGYSRWGSGQVNMTNGGRVETVEAYEDLVSLYEELTEVPQ